MSSTRNRLLTLMVATVLVVSMLPVGAASGVLDARGGAGAPSKASTVSTQAQHGVIRVRVSNIAKAKGFDVFRSTQPGVEGEKLNDEMVHGSGFADKTAKPGVQYYYTAKVSRVDTAKGGDVSATSVEVLPQVRSAIAEKPEGPKSAPARPVRAEKVSAPHENKSVPAPESAISAMKVQIGSASGPTTLTASQTWSAAAGPYFIRGDLIVPAGKTLTILPGTKVYFDMTPSGVATEYPFPGIQSVTDKIDLIVHGKIIAKGTSSSPIVFSSINSTVPSGTATAANYADWGCVFTDSLQPSEVSYCEFEFGHMGVWGHRTMRPYVSNSSFRMMGSPYPWGAVSFTDPRTNYLTPRIRIVGNRIDGNSQGKGIDVHVFSLGTDTKDRVIDPYIYGNTVIGAWPLEMYCYDDIRNAGTWKPFGGKYANVILKGTVANNKFTCSDYPVYIEAYAYGDGKNATIQTAFSGNTLISDTNEGVYAYAEANGMNGSAYCKPTFSGDKITSTWSDAVYMEAYASKSVSTSTANAYVTPTMVNCQVMSSGSNSDGVDLEATTRGAGLALAAGTFTGGSYMCTSSYTAYTYASSSHGAAYSTPVFNKADLRGYNSAECIYSEAYAYGANKLAKASPKVTGGKVWGTNDDAIYVYAYSDKGSAETKPAVYSTELRANDYGIDADAYADGNNGTGTGTAVCCPIVYDTDIIASDYDAIEAYATTNGKGAANCSPVVTGGSTLTSEDEYGIDAYSNSSGGASTCSPVLTDVDIWSRWSGVYAYARRSGDGTMSAAATASPKMTRVTAVSKMYNGSELYAENYGLGSAYVKPTIYYSDFINAYYDQWYGTAHGLYAYAQVDQTGTAEVAPVVAYSGFKADYEALYLDTYAGGTGGNAKSNGTLVGCTFDSSYDNGYYGYAYTNKGTAENNTTITGCVSEAPNDYAYEFDVYGSQNATKVSAAPTVSGGKVPYSGDGIGVWAYCYSSGGGLVTEVAPKIKNVPIVSHWDYGVYTWSYNYANGNALNNSYIYNCPISSYDGVIHEAYTVSNSTGDAVNNAKTLGISSRSKMRVVSTDDYGVYNYAYAAKGSAADNSQTKYLNVSSSDEAIICQARSDGTSKTVSAKPYIYGNTADALMGMDNSVAIAVYGQEYNAGSTTTVTISPTIASNVVNGSFYGGVETGGNSTSPVITKPVITGNTLNGIFDGNAIVINGMPYTADSFVTITKNVIPRAGFLGIDIHDVDGGLVQQNKVSEPGWNAYTADPNDAACIRWDGADATKATVKGNMFIGARGAAVYYKNGAAKTNYNSFTNCFGMVNRPFNYQQDDAATRTAGPYDARYNWWGSSSSIVVSSTVRTPNYTGAGGNAAIVKFSNQLMSCQPKLTSLTHSHPAAGKVRFVLKFDRPMDTAVKKVYFGKTSPYKTYSVTGTWNSSGTIFTTTTRSMVGLPTGVKLYFSGLLDLPGNTMYSTSKYAIL